MGSSKGIGVSYLDIPKYYEELDPKDMDELELMFYRNDHTDLKKEKFNFNILEKVYIGMKIVLALFMIISGAPFSGENNRCNDKCQNKAAAWLYYGGYVLLVAMGLNMVSKLYEYLYIEAELRKPTYAENFFLYMFTWLMFFVDTVLIAVGSYYVFIAWRGWYRAYRVGSSGNDNSVTCEHYPYLAAFSLLLLDFLLWPVFAILTMFLDLCLCCCDPPPSDEDEDQK